MSEAQPALQALGVELLAHALPCCRKGEKGLPIEESERCVMVAAVGHTRVAIGATDTV